MCISRRGLGQPPLGREEVEVDWQEKVENGAGMEVEVEVERETGTVREELAQLNTPRGATWFLATPPPLVAWKIGKRGRRTRGGRHGWGNDSVEALQGRKPRGPGRPYPRGDKGGGHVGVIQSSVLSPVLAFS